MRAVRLSESAAYKTWEENGFQLINENIQKLAENLAFEVVQQGTQKVSLSDIERWLQTTPTFLKMLEYVFHYLYDIRLRMDCGKEQALLHRRNEWLERNCLLPHCRG